MESFFALLQNNALYQRTWFTREETADRDRHLDRTHLTPSQTPGCLGPVYPRCEGGNHGHVSWCVSYKSSEPEHDGGDGEFGLVVGDALGIAGREVAELLELVEAPFDHIALLVQLGVERWWSPAAGAFGRGGERSGRCVLD